MYLETERTTIREFYPEDAGDLQEMLGDAQTMQYMEPPYDPDKTRKFLGEFCIAKKGAFAIVHKTSHKVIGYLLFHAMEQDLYEMGWIINRSFWGKGYAFEACSALIAYAFSTLHAHKIFAETIDGVRSVGLMKKLGMKPEGIQRDQTRNNQGEWADLYLYGLLESDRKE